MFIKVGDFLADYYEVRRKSDNKRLKLLQEANDMTGCYERFKTDSNDELIYNKKLHLYERECIREPIKFVRNASYFVILIGLFKHCFLNIRKFIKMEINIRKSKEE